MSPLQIVLVIAGVWLVGSGVGVGLFLLFARRIYGRGVLAGQVQAELAHGWPVAEVPVRRRGDESWAHVDRQVAGSPPRPVLYDS